MLRTPKFLWVFVLLLPLFSISVLGNVYDDYIPEENARVARIKVLEGEAQIKRSDNDKWEQATQNLPIIEGDEITTSENTRIELQFDKNSYLRLAENSYLKIVNLQEEGIAVSLSQGTLNLTIIEFDKDKGYFEVDAPQTTIAVQKEGKYRIDAGDENNKEVRVVVSKWGQARVYSDDSGFVLKNGRSAKLFLEGTYAGEWETSRNSRYGDDFDEWTAERDAIIERNLRNAYYNKYYDDSIYGAEDLNDHGEWIYARNYGYVWRPYSSSVRRYANWSPYRYGHWRWLPFHGWSWVNDEPWGYATYHYGRWIYTGGYWAWTPYGNARRSRSYWRPALVYLTYIGDSYCWYPLPYNYAYYDYNRNYRRRWRRNRGNGRRNNTPPNNPTTPTTTTTPAENIARGNRNNTPPLGRVPRAGVVSVSKDDFGTNRKGSRRPPLGVANEVLKRKPIITDTPPLIPSYKDVDSKVGKDILIPTERRTFKRREIKTGAGEREVGSPLDEKLRRKVIYGNRTPQPEPRRANTTSGRKNSDVGGGGRGTGVFDRTKPRSSETNKTTTNESKTPRSSSPQTRSRRSSQPNNDTKRPETRRRTPPTTRSTPRTERRSTPPVSRPAPRRSKPSPPPRSQPRSQPRVQPRSQPRRSSPPPKRSQPKPKRESKPKSTPSKSKSKDNKDSKN